jgi:hypothetical protein
LFSRYRRRFRSGVGCRSGHASIRSCARAASPSPLSTVALGCTPIRVNAMDEDTVTAIVNQQGCEMLEIERSRLGTPPIEDRVYWVRPR